MIPGRSIAGAIVLWFGATVVVAEPYVKITQSAGADGSGTNCSSGTLIGWTVDLSRGIFLSCAHGYDAHRDVSLEVDRRPGVVGEIIAINRDYDLSLVAAPFDRSQPIVKLVNRPLPARKRVVLAGFPQGEFQCCDALITHRIWSRQACSPQWKLYTPSPRCACPSGYQELWITDAPAPPGLSGGAVLHEGRLAGVVIGRITNSQNDGLIVPPETVSLFVKRNISLFHVSK